MRKRCTNGLVALALVVTVSALPAAAAELPIDDFTSAASGTQLVVNMNVLQDTVGSTTKLDTGLMGVIGGDRQLTVSASAAPMGDFVVAGVLPLPVADLQYSSTPEADGAIELLYDANGAGLHRTLAFAKGIQVEVIQADDSAVGVSGMDITVEITDTANHIASATQTVTSMVVFGMPLILEYPFSSFIGVNPAQVFSIRVTMDPQQAGDACLGPIQTYGTPDIEMICNDGIDNNNNGLTDCADPDCDLIEPCLNHAPTLSTTMIAVAFGVLSLVGLFGVRRMRRHG